MFEKREIKEDAGHSLQRPHLVMPAGFVPLRLFAEPDQIRIELNRPFVVVGRHSEAGLRLAYPDVSRRHCRFSFESGQWRVYDLKSLNGVYLNGEQVIDAALYAGDRVRIGNVLLLVEAGTPVRI